MTVEQFPSPPRSIGDLAESVITGIAKMRAIPRVYCDLVAAQIRRSLLEGSRIQEADGFTVDQMQSNGLYAARQMRMKLPHGMGTYRVLVLAADTPVSIGGVPCDEHFAEPLVPPSAQQIAAE